jgi:hypothetical protein
MTMGICGMDIQTVQKFKNCFIRKYFKTEDPQMIQKYGSILDSLRLIRTVFAVGFTSKNTEAFRPAIIAMSREVFFPNVQKIIGGIRFLLNTIR